MRVIPDPLCLQRGFFLSECFKSKKSAICQEPLLVIIFPRKLSIFLVTVLLTVPILALSANKLNDFELGKKAFNNKHYKKALSYFKRSKVKGVKSISLTYNLAVTYFKLGNYPQSRVYFNQIRINPRMTSLVDYNLGLIELKLNNKNQAIILFDKVYKNTTKNKLKTLAKRQLSNLNYNAFSSASHKIKSRVSLVAGYSDNVSSISTGMASGTADSFNIITAYINTALSNSFYDGVTAKLRYYSQLYTVEKRFDFNEFELNMAYNFRRGQYKNNISFLLKKSELGSNSYQSVTAIDAKFKNKINRYNYLTYRIRVENITDDSLRYSYLEGSRQRYRIDYKLKGDNYFNRFRYQYEVNDRTDTVSTSYSPQRHTFRYTYQKKFYYNWKLLAAVEYRKSYYPEKPTVTREDNRVRYLAAIDYQFSKDWDLRAAYENRNNKSNDPVHRYNRNVYALNLNWRY